MSRRLLLVLALVAGGTCLLAGAASASRHRAVATPPAASAMVLTGADFSAAKVVYQGPKIAPVFAPVVKGMSTSSVYTRSFTNARSGSLVLPEVYSTAFVGKQAGQLASLMSNLGAATKPGPSRRAFLDGVTAGAGPSLKITLVRARTLKLGDAAVELVLHLNMKGGASFDLVEVWIRDANAVSAVAFATLRSPTPGQSFAFAKLAAGHLKRAVG